MDGWINRQRISQGGNGLDGRAVGVHKKPLIQSLFIQFPDASCASHATHELVSLYSVPGCIRCITRHSRDSVPFYSAPPRCLICITRHTRASVPFLIQFPDASYASHATLVIVSHFYSVLRCITRHSRAGSLFIQFSGASYASHGTLVLVSPFYSVTRASVPLFSSQTHYSRCL